MQEEAEEEEEDGVSLEYRLAPRDSAVDSPVGLAVSFSTSPLSTHPPCLPPLSVFFPLFFRTPLLVPLACTLSRVTKAEWPDR